MTAVDRTTLFRCVGYFSADPFDDQSPPYALVVLVDAADESEASDKALRLFEDSPDELLNWYVREAGPDDLALAGSRPDAGHGRRVVPMKRGYDWHWTPAWATREVP